MENNKDTWDKIDELQIPVAKWINFNFINIKGKIQTVK
jgi:hypothetical protein